MHDIKLVVIFEKCKEVDFGAFAHFCFIISKAVRTKDSACVRVSAGFAANSLCSDKQLHAPDARRSTWTVCCFYPVVTKGAFGRHVLLKPHDDARIS